MSCIFQSLAELYRGMYQDETLRTEVTLVALVNSLTIVLAALVYKWWRHPLYGQNKGPRVYPIFGSIISYLRNRDKLLEFTVDLLKGIPGHTARSVRLGGQAFFVTANPANVEHMLKTNFDNYPKGDYFKDSLRELLGNGIFNADDLLWRMQRKVASYEFTTRSLRDFVVESTATETHSRLLPVLSDASMSGQILDLQDIFARFAFDNICQLAFGVDPACLASSLPQVKLAVAFDRATLLSLKRLQSVSKSIWNLRRALSIGEPRELRDSVRLIHEFAMDVIKNRRQELALVAAGGDKDALNGKADLLSRFMTVVDIEEHEINTEDAVSQPKWMDDHKGKKLHKDDNSSDVFLRDMIISFVLAGRDTSTAALSWFFWLLSSHPAVEQRIFEESSRFLASPPIAGMEDNRNSYTSFTFEDLKNMHYLHAALTECMRLYPPVPVDLKMARKADVWPDGTVISANAVVAYHPYAMGRMEDLWGKDCLDFKPERWLKDGVFVPESPYKYSIFQAGPRICLGKDMVMLQMKLVCASIISRFEFSISKDYKAQKQRALTLRLLNGLPVTVLRRTKKKI